MGKTDSANETTPESRDCPALVLGGILFGAGLGTLLGSLLAANKPMWAAAIIGGAGACVAIVGLLIGQGKGRRSNTGV